MFQISFYVPETHSEVVKESMFSAGAGKVGNYARCSFESSGIGQFEPMDGSQPFIGKSGKLEKVNEVKVEMVCEEQFLEDSIKALKKAHPYETPAYYVIKIVRI